MFSKNGESRASRSLHRVDQIEKARKLWLMRETFSQPMGLIPFEIIVSHCRTLVVADNSPSIVPVYS